jgi:hypothetical protein
MGLKIIIGGDGLPEHKAGKGFFLKIQMAKGQVIMRLVKGYEWAQIFRALRCVQIQSKMP